MDIESLSSSEDGSNNFDENSIERKILTQDGKFHMKRKNHFG